MEKVPMYFEDDLEMFYIDGTVVTYPLGTAFLDIINADYFNRRVWEIPATKENPLLKAFNIDVRNTDENIKSTIAKYHTATDYILNNSNPYLCHFDAIARLLIFDHYFHTDRFLNKSIEMEYIFLRKTHSLPKITNLNSPNEEHVMSSLVKTLQNTDLSSHLAEVFRVSTIEEGLFISLIKMASKGIKVKRCKCCDKYFIPQGRIDTEYCDRIAPNSSKTCREVGATKMYQDKIKKNPITLEFQRRYKKMNSRVRIRNMTQKDFFTWSEKARALRDIALEENMSIEEFTKKLDELEV